MDFRTLGLVFSHSHKRNDRERAAQQQLSSGAVAKPCIKDDGSQLATNGAEPRPFRYPTGYLKGSNTEIQLSTEHK